MLVSGRLALQKFNSKLEVGSARYELLPAWPYLPVRWMPLEKGEIVLAAAHLQTLPRFLQSGGGLHSSCLLGFKITQMFLRVADYHLQGGTPVSDTTVQTP